MDAEEKKLWELYKKTGRRELQEKLVERNLRLVHYLANKLSIYSSNSVDRDDLYSAGVMGLLEAIERFDLEKGIEFKTFASIRVRGAIIDEIRRLDWVPRSVRMKAKKVDAVMQSLFQSLGRIPSDEEIAEELEITVEEYYQITDKISSLFLHSLDSEFVVDSSDSELKIKDMISSGDEYNYEEEKLKEKMKTALINAINMLPEKEKLVISLYYYEELNLKEIGSVLNVSESRVSQLHSSALMKMRNYMKNAL